MWATTKTPLFGNNQTAFQIIFMRQRHIIGQARGVFAHSPQAFLNQHIHQSGVTQSTFVIARMKERIMHQVMGRRFNHCIVHKGPQRIRFVACIHPIVITLPITIEVEVRNVIETRLIAQALINHGRELCGDLPVTRL